MALPSDVRRGFGLAGNGHFRIGLCPWCGAVPLYLSVLLKFAKRKSLSLAYLKTNYHSREIKATQKGAKPRTRGRAQVR